tara:strand:+ start:98 stop:475 length:378 start_codon:yes stop_codon:yes gene_type:complete
MASQTKTINLLPAFSLRSWTAPCGEFAITAIYDALNVLAQAIIALEMDYGDRRLYNAIQRMKSFLDQALGGVAFEHGDEEYIALNNKVLEQFNKLDNVINENTSKWRTSGMQPPRKEKWTGRHRG